ncbi:MAG: serine protease, partial [Paludibacter sp.]|nr:serine protease [Paludibacter sp.]
MKKTIFLTMMALFSCYTLYGQISTNEDPVSFRRNIPVLIRSEKTQKIMPSLDMKKIEQEDIQDEANGMPPRFGYRQAVNYNLDNSGDWTILDGGDRIWRLTISCPGALSINLLYDKFYIPDGAKFFVYSNDRKHSIGAITSVNNEGDEKNPQGFATGLVYGDQITLEYYVPKEVEDVGVISIAYVVHGYRYILLTYDENSGGYGLSTTCNININCSQGQDWQYEKNAVAMILINGERLCTGSLVNTTAYDNRPLFLTANHCLLNGSDAITAPNLNYWSFYWQYESPGCTNASPAKTYSTSGAMVIANNSVSDFALLQLTENPWNISGVTTYYLGWDMSGNAGTSWVGIHHPNGDIKKISEANQIYNYLSQINWKDGSISLSNTHWRAIFISGFLEDGSSGSPLINNSHKVIGQLHGGLDAKCDTTYDKYYGRFDVSWTGSGAADSRRRLSVWLDPAGIIGPGFTSIDGLCNLNLSPTISGPTLICSGSSYTFNVAGAPTGITWEKSSNLTLTGSGNSVSVSAASAYAGTGWVGIKLNNTGLTRKNVWVGAPTISSIEGPSSPTSNKTTRYTAKYNTLSAPKSFEWVLNPMSSGCFIYNYGENADVSVVAGNYQLLCRATNTCGTGNYYGISISTAR